MTSFYGEYREKDIISDEEENRVSRANVDKWIFRLLLILIGFMPLIVMAHTKEVISPLISDVSILTSGTKGDLFTYYKSLIVLIITVITGLLLLAKIFFMGGKIRKTILNYFLCGFAFAIVMSTILSPNISIALSGQYNRSDGAISWLCYIALMFISMNINYPKKAVNYVMYTLMPFIFINLFIISMNFTGNDLMQKAWMQKLVTVFLPEGASLSEGSLLVGTLNQWNYMSGMFAIMTVMFLSWAIIEKSYLHSVVGFLTSLSSFAVVLMSISTSGFLTIILLLPLLVFTVLKSKNRIKGALIILLLLLTSIPLVHILSLHEANVWTQSVGFLTRVNPYIEKGPVSVKDTNNNFDISNKVYATDDSFELPKLPERAIASGSGRLYIWEKTYEIFKDNPLFGYGIDSLMYNFPHFNIDARAGLRDENIITDKPHNSFLGILYGTGIIGFIVFILICIFVCLNIFINLYKNVLNIRYIVYGTAIIAYFIQSLFNDSLPGISAVVWIFIGMMISITHKEERI